MTTQPLTISSLRTAYSDGLSASALVAQVYARIAEINDPGIFIDLFDQSEVLKAAKALGEYDPAKPLWGVPFVIKDNIDAAGHLTTAACPAYAYDANEDAFVVAELRKAGALLIGKTNLDQFATGLVGVRTPYGAPKNALDPEIVPGGSSCGSAVAVAHGIASFSLGTDTAGSGRVPAALNNIVGLKPTVGALSARGSVPACRSIETISIFALNVEDAYTAFQVAASYDAEDCYARKIAAPDLRQSKDDMIIGIPSTDSIRFFGDDVQSASFDASVALLQDAGATIREIDFSPLYAVADMLYEGAWVAERYTVIEELLKSDPDAVFPVTRQIITSAEKLSASDAFRGMYRLKELRRAAEPLLEGLDMLCVPTIPTFYTVADLEADPVTPNSNFGTYTNFVNLMDMCGLAIPTPARSDGRPGSVTLLASAGQDGLIAAYAERLEAAGDRMLGATPWKFSPRTGVQGDPGEDTFITLAVCGAHMSGLPLNGDLTKRGARFRERARTAADYRFYALAGGPPERPGLVRCTPGKGGEIEIELWDMPLENFGSFMQTIPAPLGIGTLKLMDGRQCKGFVCEAVAASDATDITVLASWRLYLNAD